MTFIVGFHCFNGLVLCADSEEDDQVNKTYVDKLYCQMVPENWEVCFGGAGDAVGVDKFRDKLFPILSVGPNDQIKTELKIEKTLQYMKKQYPDMGFSILLGQVNLTSQKTFLYRNYDNHALRPINIGEFACVGMETSLAQFLVGSVFDLLMGIDEALRVGVWATSLMKIHTSRVSGPTTAFSYKKGASKWKRHYASEIAEIENKYPFGEAQQLFRNYWITRNPDIWKTTDGTPIREFKQSISETSEPGP